MKDSDITLDETICSFLVFVITIIIFFNIIFFCLIHSSRSMSKSNLEFWMAHLKMIYFYWSDISDSNSFLFLWFLTFWRLFILFNRNWTIPVILYRTMLVKVEVKKKWFWSSSNRLARQKKKIKIFKWLQSTIILGPIVKYKWM